MVKYNQCFKINTDKRLSENNYGRVHILMDHKEILQKRWHLRCILKAQLLVADTRTILGTELEKKKQIG